MSGLRMAAIAAALIVLYILAVFSWAIHLVGWPSGLLLGQVAGIAGAFPLGIFMGWWVADNSAVVR